MNGSSQEGEFKKKITEVKTFPVPFEGALSNVNEVPFGSVYDAVSWITPSTETKISWTFEIVLFKEKVVVLASQLNLCTLGIEWKFGISLLPIYGMYSPMN